MARSIRVEFEGAVYHVMSRGNERRDIFWRDRDRRVFMKTLREMVEIHGVMIHAYCLMPNHYHFLLETPRGNLSQAMAWFQTTYSVRFNRRHGRDGHLYQGRFKAFLVDEDLYARQLVRYIHLNPVRPRGKDEMIAKEHWSKLQNYRWSSHRIYTGQIEAPEWMPIEWLGHWGKNRPTAHAAYTAELRECFEKPLKNPWDDLRGGLVLGGESLWRKARALVEKKSQREELRWSERQGLGEVAQKVKDLLELEKDRRIRIWIRVRLGGHRMVDVSRAESYSDGSGVFRVLERLERDAFTNKRLQKRLRVLRAKVSIVKV